LVRQHSHAICRSEVFPNILFPADSLQLLTLYDIALFHDNFPAFCGHRVKAACPAAVSV
jgi:hypothetical protein